MQNLLMFVPEEASILVLVGIGIAIILGFLKGTAGLSLVGLICLFAAFSPAIDGVFNLLPGWIISLILIWFVLSLVKIIFGERVSANVTSMILFNLLSAPFKAATRLILPGRRR